MHPKLAGGESISEQHRSDWHVDEIWEQGSCNEETNVDLGILENPSEKPQASTHMPKKHESGYENPAAVNTPRKVCVECLFLLGR